MQSAGKRLGHGSNSCDMSTPPPNHGARPSEPPPFIAEMPSTARRELWLTIVLGLLMGFGAISTDVYLPALPTMANALKATSGAAAFTVGGYLVGFSLAQLIWGPISDRYGRRVPIATGLSLFVVASAGCALAESIEAMIAWRIVQAVGAGSASVLARAIVRDLYVGDRAAQKLSTLFIIMAIAPLVGPLVGGQILLFWSWRGIFWLLVAVGVTALVALSTIPETLPMRLRSSHRLSAAFLAYGPLLRNRRVLGFASVGGLFYIGVYAFVSGTPFAFIDYYGVSPQVFGFLFGACVIGMMVVHATNVRLVLRYGSERLLRLGTISVAVAGTLCAINAFTGLGGLVGLIIALAAYLAMAGLIIANSVAGAMSSNPQSAGAVSALVGTLHYGIGIAGSGLIAILSDGTPRPLGVAMALAGIGCFICSRTILPRGH